jgi:hypothetical protein
MSSQPVSAGPVPVPIDAESVTPKDRPKPNKPLPTDRISVGRQLDILRAYAAASGNGTKPATLAEVSEIMKMSALTVGLAHPFLAGVGLIQRAGTAAYTVSSEAVGFLKAYEWDRETASHKLGPLLRSAWFGAALLPRLSFGAIEEKAAIGVLAEASSAPPDYEKEIRMVMEFMVAGGLIQREGGQVRLRPVAATVAEPIPAPAIIAKTEETREKESTVSSTKLNTSVQSSPGKFSLNISVEVDMVEFATWRPERIQAFFRGVAEVLAAKADVEKGGAGS